MVIKRKTIGDKFKLISCTSNPFINLTQSRSKVYVSEKWRIYIQTKSVLPFQSGGRMKEDNQ